MMSKTLFPSLLLLALFVVGCNAPAATAQKEGKGTDGASQKTSEGTATEPAPAPKEVAASLKHDGFVWMGFEKTEPVTYSLIDLEGANPKIGTQTIRLTDATDKAAMYQITRSGGLETLGSEDFEIKPDGVFQTRMSSGTLEKPFLMMPSKVEVGTAWTGSFSTTDTQGRKIEFKVNNKAERMEKVKTKAGEFDSLLVTTTGTMTVTTDGKPETNQLSSKTWYSKAVGQVKMTLEVKKAGGQNVKSSVEMAPAEKTS
jgi:hypothetical protein